MLAVILRYYIHSCKLFSRNMTGREKGKNIVTMGHPSMPALFTLTVVYFPWFETLATAVQSTADSLQKRTQVCPSMLVMCGTPMAFTKQNLHSATLMEQCVPTLHQTQTCIFDPGKRSSWPTTWRRRTHYTDILHGSVGSEHQNFF